MSGNYGKWSAILSIVCAVTIFSSYALAPDEPRGGMVVFLQILFFTSIITGILSLITSYLAFKANEEGVLKKIAPIIVLVILLVFAVSFIGIVVSFM
ncbi:hypothetical protein E2R51_08785 [Jeotgalibacillus sp. S-D1]|uniref:hypothetical protein n=1 Tax=Jeotgalibacillus sp. S-D1 TaxID=2552189 RepID=UPI00105A7CA2|nr:hypothetical protein [Jeotgalibacillus sp. S-D1]TDL32759.1 hypothetical protein E2R51_08785 [Jeotgalibacillus sp. S-D1]